MSKVRFLTKDNKGRKLKRNVPAKLVALAGKTAWVERLGNVPYAEAKERSNTFAVWTDAEVRKLKAALGSLPVKPARPDEPGFTLELTDHEIDQIAIAYFHELEKGVQSSGGYRKGVTSDNRREVLIELTEEYEEADAMHVGDQSRDFRYPDRAIETAFHHEALQQLIKYQFLEREDYEEVFQRQRGNTTKEYRRLKLVRTSKPALAFRSCPTGWQRPISKWRAVNWKPSKMADTPHFTTQLSPLRSRPAQHSNRTRKSGLISS